MTVPAAIDGAQPVREFESGIGWTKMIPELVAIAVMATVLLFVRVQFTGMVAPALLDSWLMFMACCVVARVATLRLSSMPGWRDRWPRSFLIRAGQAITFAFCAGIVASVWILMPPADDLLRLLLIILCMWFIAMVVILNADRASVIGALAVVGSMASFAITHQIPYSLPLAGFLVMEGAALVMIRRAITRSADQLRSALALVQNERDAKTRFIASASHDLQQPLQAARLYFESAAGNCAGADRDRAIAGARAAFSSTELLLQAMLEHLRLEAEAMPVRPAKLALDELMLAAANEHEPSALAAGIRIRALGRGGELTADAHMLRRMLGNLLANVVQHSKATRVLMIARRRATGTEIWVIDDGRGIGEGDADRLFEDYFQGARDETEWAGGFGLGLASARRMAELMGASIEHDRRWRCGCAFVIRFPRQA